MASTGSVDGWPLGPTELGEAGLRVLLRLPTQASSSYTELKSSCARHDVRIRQYSSNYCLCIIIQGIFQGVGLLVVQWCRWVRRLPGAGSVAALQLQVSYN